MDRAGVVLAELRMAWLYLRWGIGHMLVDDIVPLIVYVLGMFLLTFIGLFDHRPVLLGVVVVSTVLYAAKLNRLGRALGPPSEGDSSGD